MNNFIKIKRKIGEYSYKEKQEILENYNSFKHEYNITQFSKIINIKRQTLQDWINNKERINSIAGKELNNKKIGCGNKTKLPIELEKELIKWFLDSWIHGIPISDDLIRERAKLLLKESKLNINCKFSNGWLDKIKKRYNICNRKGGSKIVRGNDNDFKIIIDFINVIKKKILSYEYDSIVNIDETGIYYDPQINFTLDIKGTKRIEIKNTGREKQRLTVILGVDLFNNINIPPYIIFKGTTKRSLNNLPLSDDYNLSYQENAWCTDKEFIKFLSNFPKNKKILIIFDNFRGHKTKYVKSFLKDEYPLIEIQTLPKYTTSILQPLDVGINKPFKTFIRSNYLNWLMNNFNDKKNICQIDKKERTILLINWIKKSWKKISSETITNSFKFCGYIEDNNVSPKWNKYYMIEK